ncbi:MAG: 2-oxoacid:acceptor oxidoreductase subunit alpha [Deltaproteobacteria bacterium]|nr:2-oxoacid:acceptor oxidoreductase subunit alpha [Deltaproteobacteria bacterium]
MVALRTRFLTTATMGTSAAGKPHEQVDSVAIRFAGDSGDGMQLVGTQFTSTTALAGNDLSTLPDFPAEIRAPAGSLAGVSGYQINFSSNAVFTSGDVLDVLVAMNPAALKRNLKDLKEGGILLVNSEAFNAKNLERAGYKENPLDSNIVGAYRLFKVDITGQTLAAVREFKLDHRAATRCRNFYALGIVYWLFSRNMDATISWIQRKFSDKTLSEANLAALKAGFNYGETTEMFDHAYEVRKAEIAPGKYRNISGNEGLALGLMAASELTGLNLFLGSYPITPASDVLHMLSNMKHMGVRTLQAEDEIAAVCACVGAAYSGALAATTTSGPGMALKAEAIGLAVMLELPMVVINVQRAGPSTGMPTKTEQADLLQAMFGRNGECPLPVLSARTPGDCFHAAIEAARIAVTYMTPVILLTDGYVANGAEPWPVPDVSKLPPIPVKFRTETEGFKPYLRDDNLARPWAIPGTPGLEHRVGGIEKENLTGNISYDGPNHEAMCRLRAEKVARVANSLPPTLVEGAQEGDLLVLGWGSTYGSIAGGIHRVQLRGHKVGHVQLQHLNPLPNDLEDIMKRFKRVMVPEMNLGQLSVLLRNRYPGQPIHSHTKIQGTPFRETEIAKAITSLLEAN